MIDVYILAMNSFKIFFYVSFHFRSESMGIVKVLFYLLFCNILDRLTALVVQQEVKWKGLKIIQLGIGLL